MDFLARFRFSSQAGLHFDAYLFLWLSNLHRFTEQRSFVNRSYINVMVLPFCRTFYMVYPNSLFIISHFNRPTKFVSYTWNVKLTGQTMFRILWIFSLNY